MTIELTFGSLPDNFERSNEDKIQYQVVGAAHYCLSGCDFVCFDFGSCAVVCVY